MDLGHLSSTFYNNSVYNVVICDEFRNINFSYENYKIISSMKKKNNIIFVHRQRCSDAVLCGIST